MNKYVQVYKSENYVCLYNSLTMDIAYVHNKDFFNDSLSNEVELLLPKEIRDDDNYIETIENNLEKKLIPDVTTMFMFLNENCNMYCEYCRYIHKLPKDFKGTVLDVEKGKRQINKFITWNVEQKKNKTIVFFGTEVLLEKNILFELIRYVRKIEKEYELNNIELVVFTNGILLTEEVILFLIENTVVPIVSIDGWKELHDKARINKCGMGTFEIIQKNCSIMNSKGLRFGISLTVGEHNIDFLPEIVRYFATEFNPINIGMNPMEINNKEKREIFFEKYIQQVLEAYKVARELNISIPQVMRRIRPFVEKKHRVKECPTCGGAIRVYPTGKIGTCSHFIAVNEQCMDETEFLSTDFQQNRIIKNWSNRTQFKFENCQKCEAISLCGGGCVYNAWLQNGDIMSPDYRICTHSKYALEWCIWELFRMSKGKEIIKKKHIFVPNVKMRKLIYGMLNEDKLNLPLQAYNTYGEIKLY